VAKQTIIFDIDDFCVTATPNLLFKIRDHYPNFKCTLFTIPFDIQFLNKKINQKKYQEWADLVAKEKDWMEIAVHGFAHLQNEMNCTYEEAQQIISSAEKMFSSFKLPFVKIFKAPFWQISQPAMKAVVDNGYVLAHHPNDILPQDSHWKTYTYNHSIDDKWTEQKLIRAHGHMGTGVGNGLLECLDNVLQMPEDAEFKTIGEYMGIK